MRTSAVLPVVRGQHGLVTWRQAAVAGLTERQVLHLVDDGVLVAVHDGVFRHAAVPEDRRNRLHAAVLATRGVASHRSAGRLWGLRDVPRWRPEVTVTGSFTHRIRGVAMHRTDTLEAFDVAEVDGIPVTSPARTLLDLGAVTHVSVVRQAAEDAFILNRLTAIDLVCVLERLGKRGRRGTAALRAVVRQKLPPEEIQSRLEAALWRVIQASGVPEPVAQHEVLCDDGRQVRLDFAWPALRVAVEADGRRWHSTTKDFEAAMDRSNSITASGWDLYRFGWADVHQRRHLVRSRLSSVIRVAA